MNRKMTISPLIAGIILSFLQLCLPFLSWIGPGENSTTPTLLFGITEFFKRANYPQACVSLLLGLLPILFVVVLLFCIMNTHHRRIKYLLVLTMLALQAYGQWVIHVDFMLHLLGKMGWKTDTGYLLYIVLQYVFGIGCIGLLFKIYYRG